MKKRRRYTREFKLEAVRLVDHSEDRIADIAQELGIKPSLLYQWRNLYSTKGEASFPGSGRQRGIEEENTRLKRELDKVKEERDILKKAATYFAKELK
jgi:transposase